jgi:hypothetical protein
MKNKAFIGVESRSENGKWGLFDLRSQTYIPTCFTKDPDTAVEMQDLASRVLSKPVEQILHLHQGYFSADDDPDEFLESMMVNAWLRPNHDVIAHFYELLNDKEKRILAKKNEKGHKSVARGRGRPKKNNGGGSVTAPATTGKTRGRPRKNPVATTEVAVDAPVRGRGRPRKNPVVAAEVAPPQVAAPAEIKRGRGRPRKVVV